MRKRFSTLLLVAAICATSAPTVPVTAASARQPVFQAEELTTLVEPASLEVESSVVRDTALVEATPVVLESPRQPSVEASFPIERARPHAPPLEASSPAAVTTDVNPTPASSGIQEVAIAETVAVSITESGFDPATITVSVGTTVEWTNRTQETVRLVSGEPHRIYLPLVLSGAARVAQHRRYQSG